MRPVLHPVRACRLNIPSSHSARIDAAAADRVLLRRGNTTEVVPVLSCGSNSLQQLQQRVGRKEGFRARPAVLDSHARVSVRVSECMCHRPLNARSDAKVFAGHSVKWGGAVASVHACPGCSVEGLVVYLTHQELATLDTFEGAYTRTAMSVRLLSMAGAGTPQRSLLLTASSEGVSAFGNARDGVRGSRGPDSPPASAMARDGGGAEEEAFVYVKDNVEYLGPPSGTNDPDPSASPDSNPSSLHLPL